MATMSGQAGLDFGRLIMVPAAAGDADVRPSHSDPWAVGGSCPAIAWHATGLRLLPVNDLVLPAARSCHRHHQLDHCAAAAVIATLTPFAIPLLHAAPPGHGRQYAADGLLAAGMAWSVWSLRYLGRNLSVFAQARELVDGGPYRLIRHPLYAGEIVSSLGLAVFAGTIAAFGVLLAFCVLQGYRVLREEEILLQALPQYRGYRSRTAALFPGMF